MKKIIFASLSLLLMTTLSGCGLVEDAFKAGVIFAVVIAVIIGIIVWALHFSACQISKRYKVETVPVRNKTSIPGA